MISTTEVPEQSTAITPLHLLGPAGSASRPSPSRHVVASVAIDHSRDASAGGTEREK